MGVYFIYWPPVIIKIDDFCHKTESILSKIKIESISKNDDCWEKIAIFRSFLEVWARTKSFFKFGCHMKNRWLLHQKESESL